LYGAGLKSYLSEAAGGGPERKKVHLPKDIYGNDSWRSLIFEIEGFVLEEDHF